MYSKPTGPPLLIRADANAHIGSGHIMRCVALGQRWQASGRPVSFLSCCHSIAVQQRVEAEGISFVPLAQAHPESGDVLTTLAALEELATQYAPRPWLVLDGYHFDIRYQRAIRAAGYRLLVIDDTAHHPWYEADILLNQNIGADELPYQCASETLLLLGSNYVLLRAEFVTWQKWSRTFSPLAQRVLVTLGGGDADNVTGKVLQALQQVSIDGLEAIVVTGPNNPHYEKLKILMTHTSAGIQLLKTPPNMPELMAWADVAVGAGGSTSWELAFMGVPTVSVVLAENQLGLAHGLAQLGVTVNLGWHADVSVSRVAEALTNLCHNTHQRQEMSRCGRALISGKGADKLLAIVAIFEDQQRLEELLEIRPAAAQDLRATWRLANDPGVRVNSFNQDAIPFEHHSKWYPQKLSSPDGCIWILEICGALAAQVRYERIDAKAVEVHFAVSASFRGKGLGTRALAATWAAACEQLQVSRVKGILFAENAPSARAFEKAGFEKVDEVHRDGHFCYVFERNYGEGGQA